MPREPSSLNSSARREWFRRLERIAGDLNVLLIMFAIGLATLDLTFLVTQRLIDRLPKVTQVVHVAAPAAAPGFAAGQRDLP